ncbi:MAG: hemerythrin domain-containing protein [Betaproteobacteria bacterium]
MKSALDVIRNEHRALAAVLGALKQIVEGIASRRFDADFALLEAMIEYVTAVPDKIHHPKEDGYLFPALRLRAPQVGPILDELQEDHRTGPGQVDELKRALSAYQSAGASGLPAFSDRVQSYVGYQRQHMSKEETKVLPLAREALTAEDWASIDAAFAANGNPWEGPTGEYRQLFTRIVSLAPAPIGVGDDHRPA